MSAYQAITQEDIDAALRTGARFTACAASSGRAPSPEKVEAEFLRNHRQPLPIGSAISSHRARWYVVSVAPTCEYRVQELLRRDGFEVWLPERIVIRHAKKDRHGMRQPARTKGPLLPGYLMARFELADETWHRITQTRHVEGMLGAGGRPLALRDVDIDRLHKLIDQHGGIVELRADGSVKRDWIAGEAVKIIEDAMAGAWAGFSSARYVASGEAGTIKIEVDILGRSQVLPFAEELIVPLEAASV